MPDVTSLMAERAHLAMADLHIAEGEQRITAQRLLLERLDGDRHGARDLLRLLEQTLDIWVAHRDAILQEIARLERTEPLSRS